MMSLKERELSILNTIGENIRDLRNENNYTQYQLSIELGICRSTLSYIENGINDITLTTLLNICDLFNKDISYLVPQGEWKRKVNKDLESKKKKLEIKKLIDNNQYEEAMQFLENIHV